MDRQDRFKNLDVYLQELENEDSFSGVVVIAKNGEILFSEAIGFADRENRIKTDLGYQFELSSTSKLFTGTSILKLVEEGKINTNDKIGKYFPELEYGDKVTIHHLLTHSSGVTDFWNVEGFSYTKVKNCSDVIPFIKNQKLIFNPGDSVYYSESGMIILGALIEKVSGLSYKDYVTKNILEPLRMTQTSFINDVDAAESIDEEVFYAKKYVKSENNEIVRQTFKEEDKEFIPLSAGGIWSNASDLIKYDEGLHNYKIIKKEFVELMTKQYTYTGWPDCYFGYVWTTINSGKNEAVGHAGNSIGHHSYFYRYKKDGTVMIVLTNYGFVDIFEVADKVEKILYN
jgi:CubicO group peptidase (beta-lactamase class C family)